MLHVALRDLLDEVARDFAELARSNNVSLLVDVPALAVRADPTIILRMLQNLTANAIRHTPGGTVTLTGRRVGESVWIDVIDNGSGIAKEDQVVIFEEFTRLADSTAADSSSRLGLGLSIVSRLAALTGIDVGLASEPGKGSTFTLGPVPLGRTESSALGQRPSSRASLRGLDIVVLDDDAETLEATGKLLRKWGLNVRLAQAADQLDASTADLLVCDVELGAGPDGIEVVRDVQTETNPDIKALLISGNTSDDLAQRAARSNLTLLHKPVQPAQLKSAILTLVGTH
ncbi:MAG: hybrid sensor histidine kinase/response regulator [Pseudomonadota bacterium]